MFLPLIRTFVIVICSLLIFNNLTSQKNNMTHGKKAILLILSFSLSFISIVDWFNIGSFAPLVIPLIMFFFVSRLLLIPLEKAFLGIIVSFAASVCFYVFSAFFMTLLLTLFSKNIYHYDSQYIDQVFVFAAYLPIIGAFLKVKRFKGVLENTKSKPTLNTLFYISFIILFAYSATRSVFSYVTGFITATIVVIFAVVLIIVFQIQTKSNYIDILKERQLKSLLSELQALRDELDNYKKDNDYMSARLHSDNKLIPAALEAVQSFISSDYSKEKYERIINYLKNIQLERTKNAPMFSHKTNHISTGDINIDSIINYMVKVASDKSIQIDINGIETFTKTELPISTDSLSSVIADLIENSIHSCEQTNDKKILLDFSIKDGIFTLSISDSGDAFSINVFNHMGLSRYTTRKKDGGSGIGLMNIFDNVRAANASYTLFEFADKDEYTKKITISFDGLSEYKIFSKRKSQIRRRMARFDFKLYDYDDLNLQVSNT